MERARDRPFGFDSLRQTNGAVKMLAAPESEARMEAILGPDRTVRLCHVREDEPAGLITRQASARSRAVLAPNVSR